MRIGRIEKQRENGNLRNKKRENAKEFESNRYRRAVRQRGKGDESINGKRFRTNIVFEMRFKAAAFIH